MPLTETQAHLVIEQAMSGANVLSTQSQPAELSEVGPYTVDYVFSSSRFGVEWLSQQDRADHPDASWPAHDPDGPLAAKEGSLGQQTLHVLVLDERAYLYEANSHWVQRGASGIDSVEERLRGDVEEFLRYVAAQDIPLSIP